jgi:hypothetical protein
MKVCVGWGTLLASASSARVEHLGFYGYQLPTLAQEILRDSGQFPINVVTESSHCPHLTRFRVDVHGLSKAELHGIFASDQLHERAVRNELPSRFPGRRTIACFYPGSCGGHAHEW